MKSQEISLEFLGQRFVFKANISEKEVKEVLEYLESKKSELEGRSNLPLFKVAIWLLLQVAYDYIKVKKEKEELENYLKEQINRLGEFLEKEFPTLECSSVDLR